MWGRYILPKYLGRWNGLHKDGITEIRTLMAQPWRICEISLRGVSPPHAVKWGKGARWECNGAVGHAVGMEFHAAGYGGALILDSDAQSEMGSLVEVEMNRCGLIHLSDGIA